MYSKNEKMLTVKGVKRVEIWTHCVFDFYKNVLIILIEQLSRVDMHVQH